MTVGEVTVGAAGGTVGNASDGMSPRGGALPLASAPLSAASIFRVPLPRRGAGVGAFVLAIVTAGALAHVGVRLKGLEVAYDLGRERRIATEMEEQRRRLQIEIGMLKDPRRVIAIARDKLNMGPPAPEAIWRLGAGRQVSEWPLPPPPGGAGAAGNAADRPHPGASTDGGANTKKKKAAATANPHTRAVGR